MDELEQRLRSMRLAAPSADLDRHMDDVFLTARRIRNGSRKAVFCWWLAAVTAAGGTAALFLMAPRRSPPAPHAIVYQVEAQGRMRQMLLNPAASRDEPPRFIIHVSTP